MWRTQSSPLELQSIPGIVWPRSDGRGVQCTHSLMGAAKSAYCAMVLPEPLRCISDTSPCQGSLKRSFIGTVPGLCTWSVARVPIGTWLMYMRRLRRILMLRRAGLTTGTSSSSTEPSQTGDLLLPAVNAGKRPKPTADRTVNVVQLCFRTPPMSGRFCPCLRVCAAATCTAQARFLWQQQKILLSPLALWG